MQTFLPYPDFLESAKVLDKKRCWKQVVETKQIIDVLEGESVAWKNHPAVKMWEGHVPELKVYFNHFLYEAKWVRHIKTKYEPFTNEYDFCTPKYLRDFVHDTVILKMPWWFGNEYFHRAMRARLIEKDRAFYLPKFPNDEGFNDGKYFWPDMEDKTFKII